MATNDFFVLHLVDSADWVADHERNLCYVCTRPFGTFRRKHHCRMCGEVVCKNCTLYKDANIDPTLEPTRVRVCMSCVINNSNQRRSIDASTPPLTTTSEASRVWLQNHLQSPASGPSSEPDCEELLRSLTPKAQQHLKLRDGHFNAEGESKNSRKRSLQASQHSNEPSSEWAHPWPRPPVSVDEAARLQALHALNILDSESEKPFDMICDLAKARLSCPMAAVSFLDEHRQWFKASVGLAHKMIPRKIAFCAYTVHALEPMVVLDTLQDDRFQKNPLVSGAAGVRFYAAAPIIDPNSGHAVGSVFVLDTRPREACDISILERLALAAAENLPAVVELQTDNVLNIEIDNNAHEVADLVQVAAQNGLQSFGRGKIAVPMSPTTSATTSSMSSVGSSSAQSSLSPQKADDNDSYENQESESMAMTQLSMGTTSAGEQMEVLLMRLLTQNTETQQQLAVQQISLNTKLGQHTEQINQLKVDLARMEAKVEAKVGSK
ncbi:1-phosphatidylinositol 3-phosphate 5-kinase FAB1 [Phytophthora citrophthora]|uniref:1-phosphatidylinositol 3-phosphate 5-kinase FAB1 n=1 Tax=Phytophthora citrophthora TaxID=4793 RepID=A0AAD9GUU5_9STRA|nr:1-phosphatidylinositol 3-phosphate 5-kinase FAB1 [Phytophthora citrophthora]